MGFIQRELDRIANALREPQSETVYNHLYGAQQALAWVMEPDGFAGPFATAFGIASPEEPKGIQAKQEDCPGKHHPE